MPDRRTPDGAAARPVLRFAGATFAVAPGETVLAALLRQGVDAPYSCRKGACLSCLARIASGAVPEAAQAGLRDTLREQGYFLPCLCVPEGDLEIVPPGGGELFQRARVAAVEHLSPRVTRLRLVPATALSYRAGQFLNLRRQDGVVRSYSLASVPRRDALLELHVKRLPGGEMSGWISDRLRPGESLDIQGPNGACFYLPGRPEQPLLLIGNGTGLAPLIGIARDALLSGHKGAVHLYHGSRERAGLYLHDALTELARRYANFRYAGCLSGAAVPADCRAGRAEACALADQPNLAGWRVYLCGYPPMVHAARQAAYLAGAALEDILADPFELRELRSVPRGPAASEQAA